MMEELPTSPSPAKSETSGIRRVLPPGTPGPVCQVGRGLPDEHFGGDPVRTAQVLMPPLPPMGPIEFARFAVLLQLASGVVLKPTWPKSAFVQESFQVVSGMLPRADPWLVVKLLVLQNDVALVS